MVGLDIGTRLVKVVSTKGRSVEASGLSQLPEGCISSGRIMDPVGFVKSLSGLVDSCGLSGKDVAISLPASSVLVKKLNFPVSSDDEIEMMIEETLEEYIPFSRDEVYWDFHVLGINPSDDRYEEVLLTISKMDYVDYVADLVAASGLLPKVVEPFHFSSYNAVIEKGVKKLCLVDAGFSSVKVFAFDNGYPVVYRELENSGDVMEGAEPSWVREKAIQVLKVLESFFPGPIGDEEARFFITGGLSSEEMKDMLSNGLGVEFRFPDIPGVDRPKLYVAAFGASISEGKL